MIFISNKLVTRGDVYIFYCFWCKNRIYKSWLLWWLVGDSFVDQLNITIINRISFINHYKKTPFLNQYFVLCVRHLITLSIRFGIESIVLSITSIGKTNPIWIILFQNFLKVSLVRFLLTASSMSFLPIK